MFSLLPWKKQNGDAQFGGSEPTRQGDVASLAALPSDFDSLFSRWFDDRLSHRLSGLMGDEGDFNNWRTGWEDEEKEYVFQTELPGFEPEDIDVNVSGQLLTVRAERKKEEKGQNGSQSYHYGSFTKSLTIPRGAKVDDIDAEFRNGVLRLRLPKDESTRGRRIAVKTA